MFGLKGRVKISDRDPVFHVRLLGSTETFVATGRGCTTIPVQRICDNSVAEKNLKKVTLTISTDGMLLKEEKKSSGDGLLFPIQNISFCNAEACVNDRIFSWVWKPEDGRSGYECYAVLCSSKEKAKALALVLSRAFRIAYKEWKHTHLRQQTKKLKRTLSSEDKSDIPSSNGHVSNDGDAISVGEEASHVSFADSGIGSYFTQTSRILDEELETEIQNDSKVVAMIGGDNSNDTRSKP